MKQWLKDAVFYEIYPQSFYDTNGDGIGDLKGIIEKLDYIKELGCNALWINPCFDSPFKDAGYDVRDYKLIAPRYGTNADAKALFEAAHAKGIHVLLDLVPGHTSEEHAWFKESSKPEKNEYSDRYIWTDSCFSAGDGMPFIGGETDRNGTYILNFFKCQPALNYGYGKCREKWQMPTDAPGPRATVEAVKDVMRFWLDMGCDGFRVDMASSLVKNDTHHKKYTCAIWRDIAAMLDKEYPEAALLSEWNQPRQSLKNGFDMDFMLEWQGNGYSWLMRNYDGAIDSDPHNIGKAYFCADSGTGIDKFLDDWLPSYKATHKDGLYCLITCNHDTIRPSAGLTPDELKIAYAMLFTLPGAPFVYYGDEIGMRYLPLPTKEGGYFRTGSRTPMQWDNSANKGFSTAAADKLYLPVDDAADAPTVAAQQAGLYCLITCNHDTIRPSAGLTPDELKIAYAMLFTLPGAPFVYYGDEIGMRYLPLPTKEGGYFRTGSRTPMQWDNSANKGFSTAAADKLYLPVDDAADAPTVAAQQADPDSLWHTVQGVLNFRHSHRDLDSDAPFHVRFAPKAKGSYRPFAWERGKLICAVNPAREEAELPLKLEDGTRVLHVIGKAEVKGDELVLGAQSFAILG